MISSLSLGRGRGQIRNQLRPLRPDVAAVAVRQPQPAAAAVVQAQDGHYHLPGLPHIAVEQIPRDEADEELD